VTLVKNPSSYNVSAVGVRICGSDSTFLLGKRKVETEAHFGISRRGRDCKKEKYKPYLSEPHACLDEKTIKKKRPIRTAPF